MFASGSLSRVVIAGLAAVTATCSPEQLPEATVVLTPVAAVSSDAFSTHIALIADDIACVPDSYEFRVMCHDRGGEMVAVWGREGEGPGEFQDVMQVRRWPHGKVAVFGIGGRMTVFEPTGEIVSEVRIPGTIMVNGIDSTKVFGLEPRFGGGEDYKARPKDWFMGGQAMKFDSRSRLWIGTRHDHSDYSYIDVWTGTEYSGSVRVHDRLIGFDILGSTLVTVVRRPPDRRGILGQAIDWYDIREVEFGS